MHEYGIDQVIAGEVVFAHQPAREVVATHAPGTGLGISHELLLPVTSPV
jgi:hypothetical protein